MYLTHISGVNQLADGMTKMDTSIDYVGRLVQSRADFLKGIATPVRDLSGKVLYKNLRSVSAPPRSRLTHQTQPDLKAAKSCTHANAEMSMMLGTSRAQHESGARLVATHKEAIELQLSISGNCLTLDGDSVTMTPPLREQLFVHLQKYVPDWLTKFGPSA